MGVVAELDALRERVRSSDFVVARGGGTHARIGNAVAGHAIEVRAPRGIVAYDARDLTVTVRAGTTVAELMAVLAEHGQFVPLDVDDESATIGGTIASGLSGHRRLRYGPLRDTVLAVQFAAADGQLVTGGGPTVKNVSGYDLPRLFTGSLGTLGVVTQVTLRCRPRPSHSRWFESADSTWNADALRRLFSPSAAVTDGKTLRVLLEGTDVEISAQARETPLREAEPWPRLGDAHQGRISVGAAELHRVVAALLSTDHLGSPARTSAGMRVRAEIGVGTIRVGAATAEGICGARSIAESHGGWLLCERGADELDGYGIGFANAAIMSRVKQAFDPTGKFAPGRMPL